MMTGSILDRRRLIGGLVATALLPALAEAQVANDPARKESSPMRIRMSFDGRVLTAFEQKGITKGRAIRDLTYRRV